MEQNSIILWALSRLKEEKELLLKWLNDLLGHLKSCLSCLSETKEVLFIVLCRTSQVAEFFTTTSPEIVVREARIEDFWEVAETHCTSFFPEYSFPLDFVLRFDRLIGMLFGFSTPKGCKRDCLVAVIGSSGGDSFFLGSYDFKFGGFDGNFILNKGYVAGILTVDTVANFLPRKGPLQQRR